MRAFGIVLVTIVVYIVESNRYAEQLYEDLLYYYNKNVRPVKNASESIKVKFGASLIRIIDVEKLKFSPYSSRVFLKRPTPQVFHKQR
uniref:Nicotinic acetylcholine receptor alpha subunit isoform b n=1 Tax=Haemonchus contortus TaxID=6289 RepID=D2XI63_HAECO|nr:nicotinic acetylcholine receptor alpha subunit isoform b [Haemonchus contortus]